MKPKRIYLDTNHWIALAQVSHKLKNDLEVVKTYHKIKNLADSGDAVFPISFFHLEDMMVRQNKDSRERLIDFMVSISKGWVIRPYNLLIYEEVSNAALRRLGRGSFYDIRAKMIAKGLPHAISQGYKITWNQSVSVPEDFEQKLKEEVEKPETMLKLLKSDDMSKYFREGRKQYIDAAKRMEQNRLRIRNLKKKERYNAAIADYLLNTIGSHLMKFLGNANLTILKQIVPRSKSGIESFLEDMPATNIVFRLTYGRDEFYHRPIQPNDITDINHLSGAIPYCDIVVTEKMFGDLARQLKLDKKYGCTIFSSLKELNTRI